MLIFDEIEKAHHDVFNIMLQILDDGRVTDNQGRMVSFKNSVIIMTSNIGAEYLLNGAIDAQGHITSEARNKVMAELRRSFRPEFLNRVDDVVLFKPLQLSEIEKIVELIFQDLNQRLSDRQIPLELTPGAREFIAKEAYDLVYGARPLKRYIQREVETKIGRQLIAGNIKPGTRLVVDVRGGAIYVGASRS